MAYAFESARLGFRRLERSDADDFFRFSREAGLAKWIPNQVYENVDEAEDVIDLLNACWDDGELPYVAAVELKSSGELIGHVGLSEIPEGVEIGYAICDARQGVGYATEAVKAFCQHVGEKFGAREIWGVVMKGNAASYRVLMKSGFAFVRNELRAEDGKPVDRVLYKLTL